MKVLISVLIVEVVLIMWINVLFWWEDRDRKE